MWLTQAQAPSGSVLREKLDAIVGEYVRQKPELSTEILSPDHRFGAVSTNNAKKNLFRFIQALTRANITIPI